MYKIGDRVVYPLQGAGTIVDIQTKDVLGEELKFYIIKMPIADIKISIPVNNVDQMGLRPVMSKEDGQKVMEILKEDSTSMPKNWSQRYRQNMENLKINDPFEMAEVVRNLQMRDIERGLSTSEKKMLNNTKKMLISELIIAGSISVEEASQMIDEAISQDMEEETEEES